MQHAVRIDHPNGRVQIQPATDRWAAENAAYHHGNGAAAVRRRNDTDPWIDNRTANILAFGA